MTTTATITRSTTAAGAGDSGAGVATFERDAETGVITFGGQDRQLWVLVFEGTEKQDVPTQQMWALAAGFKLRAS